jgi:hypothetical protein
MWLSVAPDVDAVAAKHPALASIGRCFRRRSIQPKRRSCLPGQHTFADAQKPLLQFALGKSVTATVVAETSHVVSPNIVGELKGSDPKVMRRRLGPNTGL